MSLFMSNMSVFVKNKKRKVNYKKSYIDFQYFTFLDYNYFNLLFIIENNWYQANCNINPKYYNLLTKPKHHLN